MGTILMVRFRLTDAVDKKLGRDVNLDFMRETGFKKLVFIEEKTGLDILMPEEDFDYKSVVDILGTLSSFLYFDFLCFIITWRFAATWTTFFVDGDEALCRFRRFWTKMGAKFGPENLISEIRPNEEPVGPRLKMGEVWCFSDFEQKFWLTNVPFKHWKMIIFGEPGHTWIGMYYNRQYSLTVGSLT